MSKDVQNHGLAKSSLGPTSRRDLITLNLNVRLSCFLELCGPGLCLITPLRELSELSKFQFDRLFGRHIGSTTDHLSSQWHLPLRQVPWLEQVGSLQSNSTEHSLDGKGRKRVSEGCARPQGSEGSVGWQRVVTRCVCVCQKRHA